MNWLQYTVKCKVYHHHYLFISLTQTITLICGYILIYTLIVISKYVFSWYYICTSIKKIYNKTNLRVIILLLNE